MGKRFSGVLVPSERPAVREAFDLFRSRVPLCLTRVSRGVLGVYCFGGGPRKIVKEEYQRIARRLSEVAGSALVYCYDGAAGTSYQLFEKGRLARSRDDEWDENEIKSAVGVGGDQVETAFCGGCESLSMNVPSLLETIHGLEKSDFASSKPQRRTSLMNRIQTAERMIEARNYEGAASLLEGVLEEVQHCITGSALSLVAGVVQATIARIRDSSDSSEV